MRRIITLAAAAALLVGSAVPALAGVSEVHTVEVRLVDTTVVDPGSTWQSNGILHARDIEVLERMVTTEGGTEIGKLGRSVSFNWDLSALADGDVVSQAWCSFTMSFEDPSYGAVPGRCVGSLLSGAIVGNGSDAFVRGTYVLEGGGTPGVGPYLLSLEIRSR